MRIRTYHRINTGPALILTASLLTLIAVLTIKSFSDLLREQLEVLPLMVIGLTVIMPILFSAWYLSCYAESQRGILRVRWFWRVQQIDLKLLEHAEVFPVGGKKGKALALRLEDENGFQLWLPLDSWRDESLLMACVLRATVDRRVLIDGDPRIVRRFSSVLDSYKSWDRKLAA